MQPVPWNREFTLSDSQYRAFRIGDLCLVVLKMGAEWYVSSFRGQVMPFPDEGVFEDLANRDLTWQRWEATEEDRTFLIRPALPPLPVISRPSELVTLPSGAKARFFIAVPSFVEIVGECDKVMLVLLSAPMQKLTYTWRGADTPSGESKSDGEVCISLHLKVYSDYRPGDFDPGVIVSPIEISNHRREPLPFSRIRLDTDYLSLYLTDMHAWSNFSRLNSYDDPVMDGVVYAKGPPGEAGENTLLSGPRLQHNRRVKKPGAIDMIVDRFKLHI